MQSEQRSPKPARTPEVDADVVASLVEGGALVLDVRESEEWVRGHAPGALHIPLGDLEAHVGELPVHTRILVVCRSGLRSAVATDALVAAGFDATNLAGGMQSWARASMVVVTDEGTPGSIV